MSKHERRDFVRPKEDYDTSTLCEYARDILLVRGDPAEEYGRMTTSWEDTFRTVHVTGDAIETDDSTYEIKIIDNFFDNYRFCYVLSPKLTHVAAYDDNKNPIRVDTPVELVTQLMQYLRDCPNVEQPLTDKTGQDEFNRLAANVAIESAIEAKDVNLRDLAASRGSDIGEELYEIAIDRVLEQGVHLGSGSEQAPYTRSRKHVDREIGRILLACDVLHSREHPLYSADEHPPNEI